MGQNIVDGLLYTIALLLWFLPILVLVLIGVVAGSCTSTTDAAGAATSSCGNAGAAVVFSLLATGFALFVVFVHPAIYAQYTASGFGAAFQVPQILARVRRRAGLTFGMIGVGILAGIVALLGLIALVIGVLVTAPYAQFVLANAYGQYARLTDPPGAPPS